MAKRVSIAAAVLTVLSSLGVARATTTPTTLYFHSDTAASDVDETAAEAALTDGPTMDANPPAGSADHIATATPVVGNPGFRKNFLGAWWAGSFTGYLSGNPTVTFWASSVAANRFEVVLFDNGPIGVASQLGVQYVDATPGLNEYTVTFDGLEAAVEKGLVIQIHGDRRVTGPDDEELDDELADALVLFDSTAHPSRVSFDLGPIPVTPKVPALDDPFGIAFNGADLLVANSGTGDLVRVDQTDFSVQEVLHGGLVPGGFARGMTGVAVDGDGNVYAAIAETGEILTSKPGSVPSPGHGKKRPPPTPTPAWGAYARGLGTPIGIAFGPDGALYVADQSAKRVVRIDPATRAQTVVADDFAAGPYGLAFAPDGKLAVSTQRDANVYVIDLAAPAKTLLVDLDGETDSAEGLAFDTDGGLYIGDGRAGALLKLEPGGEPHAIIEQGLGGPISLAFRPGTGDLVIATQGEGGDNADEIRQLNVADHTGFAPAAPTGLPGALAPGLRTWVHESVPNDGAARPLNPDTFTGLLTESTARYTGENAVEPTLGIQSDGDIFISESRNPCSIVLVVICGRTEIFRSRDLGANWSEVTPDNDQGMELPPVSADPYVVVDRDTNRVFDIDLTAACTYLSYSDDDGQTWTNNPLGCSSPPVDHQTFALGKPRTVATQGYPNVALMCSNAAAASPCQRSVDGGDTWETVSPAFTGEGSCGSGLTSHLHADADGRFFLPIVAQRPCVAISEDDGTSWTIMPVSTTVPGDPADHEGRIASDADGNLYYVWLSTDRLPYLVTSRDHGLTWSAPRMIAPPGVTNTNLASIVAGAPGKVAVSYMGST
ncbi:MAG: hypothetical protein LC750_08950, partial [Actinobacteria bacterium]|nr:hypothetical protein [Actinomycetota bacterium]